MRLKTLELQGYKSFASKSLFQFDDGVTAIVGPNGSGKSNVADAVRWVLGEQSYAVLRGKRTEDMIFFGSDGRARLGMAQVTLVFDNQDGWLPIDFAEVTITRRAYRDGDNDYLLNGNRVRLRDLGELLAAGGLGRHTYTLIGQGLIDAALALRPEERRLLFEEAAGISLHHSRRADALSKLDTTQANLLRLHDIVNEIGPRLSHLEKQAERTSAHQTISTHLQGLLRTWYGYRWGEGEQRLHAARMRAEYSQRILQAQHRALEGTGQQIETQRAHQNELRQQLGEWHRQGSQLRGQAESVQRQLAVLEERDRLMTAQHDELEGELEPLEVSRQATQARVTQAAADLAQLDQELASARQRVEALQAQLGVCQARRQALLDQQSRLEQEARLLADRCAGQQARLAQLGERRAQLDREASEAQSAIATHQQAGAEIDRQLLLKRDALEQAAAEVRQLDGRRAAHLTAIEALTGQAAQLTDEINTHRRETEAARARQDLLSKMQRDMVGYYEGVRSILKAAGQPGALGGVLGSVAQLLNVPTPLETAIETLLGGHLQDLVVETWADAEAAIAYLKTTHGGRATFLPLDTVRPPELLRAPAGDRVVGLAADLVTCEKRLLPVAHLLLGRSLVVEDLPAARQVLSALRGNFQVVTRAGDLVRSGGSVSGGSVGRDRAGTGFLARQREWQELPASIAAKEAVRRTLETRLDDNRHAQDEHRASLQELDRRKADLLGRQAALERERAGLARDRERSDQAVQWQQTLLERIQSELTSLDQSQAAAQAEIEPLQTAHRQAQLEADQLADRAAALTPEALLTQLSRLQAELAGIEGHHHSQRTILDGHSGSLAGLTERIQAKQSRIAGLDRERGLLAEQLSDQRQRSEQLDGQIAQLDAFTQPAEAELAHLEQRRSRLETEEAHQRQTLSRLEAEYSRLTLELGRRQDDMDLLRRRIEDELGLVEVELSEDLVSQPPLPLHPLISQLPTVRELPEDLEAEMRRLRAQLSRLGAVNHNAPQEYEEVRSRHEFLTRQVADLEQAAANLRQVISELDRVMEHDFLVTFEAVATQFETYFKQLFDGGEGRLVLTDPHDLSRTGVDIIARPPGKRAQNLSMLSGGERALTAAALVFALLKISPTPFCILDEVDAMLDEANVGRFRQALEDLSQEIQFIVITHNRHTIEAASAIYGISMGNDSVSRVISLKLDHAPGE